MYVKNLQIKLRFAELAGTIGIKEKQIKQFTTACEKNLQNKTTNSINFECNVKMQKFF